ncbi:MAG: PilZ domain-containing protein [Myxococcota bacterium]|nr:PilZ domain-containing protein [Myxococcota bacterium]
MRATPPANPPVVRGPAGPACREVARRLGLLGLHAACTRPSELGAARAAPRPRALVLDADLPAAGLEEALEALGPALEDGATALAAGPAPPAARRARLRAAGVTLALFDPLDDATLRHQVNRTFLAARQGGRARRELRAPVPAAALLVDPTRGRRIPGTVYTLSEGGAFVETAGRAPPGATLELRIALGPSGLRLPATVVHAHPPGAGGPAPTGLGLRFAAIGTTTREIGARVRARCEALAV